MEGTLEAHLRDRGVDPSRTFVIVDEDAGLATFLLYNLSGQLVGFQQYNPAGEKANGKSLVNKAKELGVRPSELMRYFTRVADERGTKKVAVWGTETLDERPYVFITEGIFDAVKVHNAGHPCIAVLANRPMQLRPWLHALGKRIIAIIDSDAAGRGLKSIADEDISVPEGYKDLGDMPQQDVDELIERELSHMSGV